VKKTSGGKMIETEDLDRELFEQKKKLSEIRKVKSEISGNLEEFRKECIEIGDMVVKMRDKMNRAGNIADKIMAVNGWEKAVGNSRIPILFSNRKAKDVIKQMQWRNHSWLMYVLGIRDKKGMK